MGPGGQRHDRAVAAVTDGGRSAACDTTASSFHQAAVRQSGSLNRTDAQTLPSRSCQPSCFAICAFGHQNCYACAPAEVHLHVNFGSARPEAYASQKDQTAHGQNAEPSFRGRRRAPAWHAAVRSRAPSPGTREGCAPHRRSDHQDLSGNASKRGSPTRLSRRAPVRSRYCRLTSMMLKSGSRIR